MKNILIIGLGRFGRHAAAKLLELRHQVLGIDRDEAAVNAALPTLTTAQIGDGTNEKFLKSLEVSNFDLCIVAIGDDFQSSLETTYLLKELGAREVVSRASRSIQEKFLLRNGADHVVYPEKQLAEWTAIRYSSDNIFDYMELDSDYAVYEVQVPGDWSGRTIGELNVRRNFAVNIIGVRKDGVVIPTVSAGTQFEAGQTILVLGRRKDIAACFKL